jgi:hypothetical protein
MPSNKYISLYYSPIHAVVTYRKGIQQKYKSDTFNVSAFERACGYEEWKVSRFDVDMKTLPLWDTESFCLTHTLGKDS